MITMATEILVFQLAVLIFSVIIHEISHGYVAEYLGDPTARNAGRLTLNPIPHLSLFGMVIMPIISYLSWGILVGGAKPVPYNPNNLKDPRRGGALIAVAGPASNLFIALVFGILLRITSATGAFSPFLGSLFGVVIYLNILLAVFNLVPIPPLDGSKVVNLFLSRRAGFYWDSFWNKAQVLIQRNFILSLILFFLFFQYVLSAVFFVIAPVINSLFTIIAGQPIGF
jgi:Zn-dependent protease